MLPELTTEELSAALDWVVAEILDKAGVDRPPVDAFAVADALGFTVAWDNRQTGRARLLRLAAVGSPQTSILVRAEPRQERRQFAVAHEIGEAFAYRVFRRLGVEPAEVPVDTRENIANYLAGRLLLPTSWLCSIGVRHSWDLPALKLRFSTASHELIARRMLDFPPPVIITILDDCEATFRRTNLAGRTPPFADVERRCQQMASATGETASEETSLMTVRAWPIHEPNWHREIIRTELLFADEPA